MVYRESNGLCNQFPWKQENVFVTIHYLKGKWKCIAEHMQTQGCNPTSLTKNCFHTLTNTTQFKCSGFLHSSVSILSPVLSKPSELLFLICDIYNIYISLYFFNVNNSAIINFCRGIHSTPNFIDTSKHTVLTYIFLSIYKIESPWMLHMYKNMHYLYINIYTMCKTWYYKQQEAWHGWWRKRRFGYNEDCKSTDEGGEPWCLICASTNVPKTHIL